MKPASLCTVFAATLVLATCGMYLGMAVDSRRHSLGGRWLGEFRVDTAAVDTAVRRAIRTPTAVPAEVALAADSAPHRHEHVFWDQTFAGEYRAQFEPVVGRDLPPMAPPALGVRYGRDSVRLSLGPPCCDDGGLRARGRIVGDTLLVGSWFLDLDGELVAGRFRLRRR